MWQLGLAMRIHADAHHPHEPHILRMLEYSAQPHGNPSNAVKFGHFIFQKTHCFIIFHNNQSTDLGIFESFPTDLFLCRCLVGMLVWEL